uniref:Uncharacterized protein LOC117360477 isoform X2 n=1 Tax=Geotrypetes seraphini TaxID=260995 RepID=A0A6P8QNY9_GEOSA|nr:uncharacterized protein LOC117360477 isoform X2 [Geotrypetes seraphini]
MLRGNGHSLNKGDMEAEGVLTTKVRARRFTDEEFAVLVNSVVAKFKDLFHSTRLSSGMKLAIWAKIASDVSCKRSVLQCKHCWKDIRAVVKANYSKICRHAKGTGGGPPCAVELSDLKRHVLRTLHSEQIVGIPGGVDTSAPVSDYGNAQDGHTGAEATLHISTFPVGRGQKRRLCPAEPVAPTMNSEENEPQPGTSGVGRLTAIAPVSPTQNMDLQHAHKQEGNIVGTCVSPDLYADEEHSQ